MIARHLRKGPASAQCARRMSASASGSAPRPFPQLLRVKLPGALSAWESAGFTRSLDSEGELVFQHETPTNSHPPNTLRTTQFRSSQSHRTTPRTTAPPHRPTTSLDVPPPPLPEDVALTIGGVDVGVEGNSASMGWRDGPTSRAWVDDAASDKNNEPFTPPAVWASIAAEGWAETNLHGIATAIDDLSAGEYHAYLEGLSANARPHSVRERELDLPVKDHHYYQEQNNTAKSSTAAAAATAGLSTTTADRTIPSSEWGALHLLSRRDHSGHRCHNRRLRGCWPEAKKEARG